jgi:hypothetical protein
MTEGALDELMGASMERLFSQVNSSQERYCTACDRPTSQLFISQLTEEGAAREFKFVWRRDNFRDRSRNPG